MSFPPQNNLTEEEVKFFQKYASVSNIQLGFIRLKGAVLDDPEFVQHRVFLNNVDSYHGRIMSKFIAEQIVGGTHPPEEEEVEEEEEEEGAVKKPKAPPPPKLKYEILGTMIDLLNSEPPKEVTYVVDPKYKHDLWTRIWRCGFIIYDITSDPSQIDEAMWTIQQLDKEFDGMQQELPKAFAKLRDMRVFILISTVMTWARTKFIDDDPDTPFNESHYRKRKPHPKFKKHCDLEKEVVRVAKKHTHHFKAFVICSGITYGGEEGVLHFLFKMGWENELELPVFASGKQLIPLIHINDLCNIVYNIMENFPEKLKFILAVAPGNATSRAIVKSISKRFSTGKVRKVKKEVALELNGVTEDDWDWLTINLNMEPTYVVEEMTVIWKYETGFVENIDAIANEYVNALEFKTIKIFLHGPPAVGKTLLAKRLCDYYKLHHIYITDVIKEAVLHLEGKLEKKKDDENEADEEKDEEEDEGGEDEEEVEEEEDEEAISEFLNELKTNLKDNGKLPDELIVRLMKERLMRNDCRNQGCVLDGFPKTHAQAALLFQSSEDEEGEGEAEEDEEVEYNLKIIPHFIYLLEASDDFIYGRLMVLPEDQLDGTRYSEEEMYRRMGNFRTIDNDDDKSVFSYLYENGISVIRVNVEEDDTPNMDKIFSMITEQIGLPTNYGPPAEVLKEIIKNETIVKEQQEEELVAKEKRYIEGIRDQVLQLRKKKLKTYELLRNKVQDEQRLSNLKEIKKREAELKRQIGPTLHHCLYELVNQRPEDPIDKLATSLYTENPRAQPITLNTKRDICDFGKTPTSYVEASEEFIETLARLDPDKNNLRRKAKKK